MDRAFLLYRYEATNRCIEVILWFVDARLILPQHVSTIHCHHQGAIVDRLARGSEPFGPDALRPYIYLALCAQGAVVHQKLLK
jgi:hypothetical protein